MISLDLVIEIIATITSLVYLFLLMRENIWCWFFAIISAILSIYSFANVKLYSEAFLYTTYIFFSIYGWYKWSNDTTEKALTISKLPVKFHGLWIVIGFVLAFLLGYLLKTYTDAEKSFIDSNTTIFSFIASYLQTRKYLYSWVYWIIVNGTSIWLYFSQGLSVYAGLMVVYFVMSGVGLWKWRKSYLATNV
ncbi:MAG: nicotinamide riboside transporter PnuC [Saprospiraceae bacterium]